MRGVTIKHKDFHRPVPPWYQGMSNPVLHTEVTPALSLEAGIAVLGVGIVVLAVISYDLYRHEWVEGS